MADILQKHMNGTDDTSIKAALVPKELGFNETTRNAIYKHLNGVTFDEFFSADTLGKTTTPSGATLIGVNSAAFTQITGLNVQALFADVDTKLNAFPWVLTKTSAELKILLENANQLNGFHIGPQVQPGEISATLTSDKNIWGFSKEQLSFKSSSFGITFPTLIGGITDGTTAFVRFYTPCTTESSAMFTSGGIDSDTTGIKLVGMTEAVGSGTSNAPIEYEVSESNIINPNVNCVPWSGLNQILKPVQNSWRKQVLFPRTGLPTMPTFGIDDEIAYTGDTIGVDIWVKNYQADFVTEFSQALRREASGIPSAFIDYFGGIVKKFNDVEGHLSIGNLPNDWYNGAMAFDLGTFTFVSASNDTSYFGSNAKEVANNDWRFSASGFAQRITFNKSTGVYTSEISSVSGSVDDPITWVIRDTIDSNGNRAFNGATIPSGVASDTNLTQHFYPNGKVIVTALNGGDPETHEVVNAYVSGYSGGITQWKSLSNNYCQRIEFIEWLGLRIEYNTSTSFPTDSVVTWTETKRVDNDGNRAFNGATIPSSLNSDFVYTFYEESCVFYKISGGTVYNTVNVYLDSGSVWKSMKNTGLNTSITVLSASAYQIRKSTATATSAGQTMTMTTIIVPS